MENAAMYTPKLGDQAQIFKTKHGEAMVIWRRTKVVWVGPANAPWREDSRIIIRDFTAELPIRSHADFTAERKPK